MKHTLIISALLAVVSFSAHALDIPGLTVKVEGIAAEGARIAPTQAFCTADEETNTKDGGNISPAINWSAGPAGTKSYAVIMHDPDVPTIFDDANQSGKVISKELPRQDFYHWVLVDVPASKTSFKEGEASDGVNYAPAPYVKNDKGEVEHLQAKPVGKPVGKKAYGLEGKNDYSTFMGSVFGGYDGPCPPWNDELMHRYYFTVYALDVETLGLPADGNFTGAEALKAMEGHILNRGSVYGTYTQNPELLKQTQESAQPTD